MPDPTKPVKKKVEPFITSDLDIFNDRNQAYQDSLDIFNSHKKLKEELLSKGYTPIGENPIAKLISSVVGTTEEEKKEHAKRGVTQGIAKRLAVLEGRDSVARGNESYLKDSQTSKVIGRDNMYNVGDIFPSIVDQSFGTQLWSPNILPQSSEAYKENVPFKGFGDTRVAYDYSNVKPKQPVIYDPPIIQSPVVNQPTVPQRPSYQQILTKQPNLQSFLITDEQLTPTYVKNAIEYPKDVQRFTAGNYLESQGKPSGYVNYGDNKGRKELYQDGGVHDPTPKGNTTSVNNLGFLPDNYLNDIINKDLLIQENNKQAAQWATNHPNNVVQRPINNDKIDYPNTDRRSGNYVGNPNWSFAAPNMTGKQRADAESYHGDIIGSELAGIGIMKGVTTVGKHAYKINPSAGKLNKYNRVVDQGAIDDAFSSKLIRVKSPSDKLNVKGSINLDRRGTTPLPSFGKGIPDKDNLYMQSIVDRGNKPYIISTNRNMSKSTLGRHGANSTMFPVDNNGKYMKNFPTDEAKIFNYDPHWWKGYEEIKPTFANGGIHNLNRSNISETFDEMFVNKYK